MKVLLVTILSIANCAAQDHKNPNTLIQEFCSAEFLWNPEIRNTMITYSKQKMVAFNKKQKNWQSSMNPASIDPCEDPVSIATSYKIMDISTTNNSGTATIKYNLIGESKYNKTTHQITLSKSLNANTSSVLHIIKKTDGFWYVEDPSIPVISRDRLIELYKNDIKRIKSTIDANPNRKIQHLINILKHKTITMERIQSL